jgi:hypothetical protein
MDCAGKAKNITIGNSREAPDCRGFFSSTNRVFAPASTPTQPPGMCNRKLHADGVHNK